VVTRIKRWDKGNFREGYVPNPEHRGGPWGVAWTNFPQRASLPPGIEGGDLEKGGRGKGGTRIERRPRVPQRSLQRRKTQGISSCQDGHTRALNGRDHSQIFQAFPPGKKNEDSEKFTRNGEAQHEKGTIDAQGIRATPHTLGDRFRTRIHAPSYEEFFSQNNCDHQYE
jgi:hypothetical protein